MEGLLKSSLPLADVYLSSFPLRLTWRSQSTGPIREWPYSRERERFLQPHPCVSLFLF